MQLKLRFLGAAQNVTGSRHLLEANGTRILVDCGLYQEREFRDRNWAPFVVPPASIDAVCLTHAHLDHCGLLPKLVREGFQGKIYCTGATAEIAKIILLDSARLQMEDAEHKRRRHERQGRKVDHPVVPLYTVEDVEATVPLFVPIDYRQPIRITEGIELCLCDAGHVLGSSLVNIKVSKNGETRRIVFSGDIGRPDRPIVHDPEFVSEADYVLIESTYGDRVHHKTEDIKRAIGEIINSTKEAGGNIIVPSFALERSQELLFYVNELLAEDVIPHIMVFLDSPMAASITKVFRRHHDLFDKEMMRSIHRNGSPFSFPGLKITETSSQSKAINHIRGTVMVIAGSGMCTGGRIKHHLINNITRPESTVMFVGYQAFGTLGRRIVEGEKRVRILGQEYDVKARIAQVHGFSAHADKNELLQWLEGLTRAPRKVFVVHGEVEGARNFAEFIRSEKGWDAVVPGYQDDFVLE